MIVADTNLLAYFLLEGDVTERADNVYSADPVWIAPPLWRSEFRNVLALYMRQERLTAAEALRIIGETENLMRGGEHQPASLQVLGRVNESTCSAYDCEFVALARDLGVRLVTVDKQILGDFPKDAIALDVFIAENS